MPLHEAVALAPELIVIRPASSRYREASRAVHAILRRFASPEKIEGIGLDEAYIDVTARTRHGTTTPKDIARQAKFMIRNNVGLTASCGAAAGKGVPKC